jgi:hypothetical protein
MIAQLADYESQIYKKIYKFNSSNIDDYVAAAERIITEVHDVVSRSG